QRFDAIAQILDLRHGEGNVVGADAARALADVDQPILVAVEERPQQHAAHHAEDGGVGADAERQCEYHGHRKPLGASERAERNSQIMKEQLWFENHRSTSLDYGEYICHALRRDFRALARAQDSCRLLNQDIIAWLLAERTTCPWRRGRSGSG